MIKVRIPTPLRPLTKGQGEVETKAASVLEMIEALNTAHPALKIASATTRASSADL